MTLSRTGERTDQTIALSAEAAIFDRPTLFFASALFLAVLGIYLFTLSNNYSPDSMAFAVLATQGRLSEPLFFQAEHLLYPFAGWLWYQLWMFFGYEQGALVPMQILNALGGAAGVTFFFLSLRLLLGSPPRSILISLLCAFLLAGSFGYWYHSTDAEDQIISNALVLGAFLLLVLRMRETRSYWYPLSPVGAGFKPAPTKRSDLLFGNRSWLRGMAISIARSKHLLTLTMSLAILFHGTAALFLPALLFGLWLKKRDARPSVGILAGVVVLVGAALVAIGGLAHGFRSPAGYLSWLLAAPGVGVWGEFSPRSVWIGAQTLADAIVSLQGGISFKALLGGNSSWQNSLGVFLFLGAWALVLLTGFYLIYFRGRLIERRAIALICLIWLAASGLFNLYWAPEDIQFWIQMIPPLIVALSIAYLDLVAAIKHREELLNSLFLFGLAAVFIINLITTIIPRASFAANTGLRKALCLEQATGPDDLIITPGWDWAGSYVPYFTKRELLSLVDTYLLTAGGDRATLFRLVDERLGETVARGGRVYVVRLFGLNQNDSDWFKRTTGLTADDFPFKRRQAGDCGGEVLWEVVSR